MAGLAFCITVIVLVIWPVCAQPTADEDSTETERVLHELMDTVVDLHVQLKQINKKVGAHDDRLGVYDDKLGVYDDRLGVQENITSILTNAHNTVYAFTAAMGPGETRSYSGTVKVDFPVVLSNIGDGYDPSTSQFTCLVSGVYMFSLAIWCIESQGVAHIMVDNVNKVSTLADGRSSNVYGHSTNIVVVECTQGQKVWIKIHEGGRKLYDNGDNYGTFTGILLHTN